MSAPYFVRVSAGKHEWGYHLDVLPGVGDTLFLDYGEPDELNDDGVFAVVTKRCFDFWIIDSGTELPTQVHLHVALEEPIPEGCIASSSDWPSETHSRRKQEQQDWLREHVSGK